MTYTVIFTSIEEEIIASLNEKLALYNQPISTNVHVSNEKAPPEVSPQPTKQVVIHTSGGAPALNTQVVIREFVTVNVYAMTDSEANELGKLIEAILKTIKTTSIKNIKINATSSPVFYEGQEKMRYLNLYALVKGTNFRL